MLRRSLLRDRLGALARFSLGGLSILMVGEVSFFGSIRR
jgi:hypothetical protein